MADTAAERKRRSRAHGKGDHSLCDQDRCRDARLGVTTTPPATPVAKVDVPQVPDPAAAVDEVAPGGIEQAVTVFVAALNFPAGDPRAILGTIAVRLAKRVDESGALPAAVRELRVLLAQISEVPGAPAGPVDEVRVQRAWRRLDALIATAA